MHDSQRPVNCSWCNVAYLFWEIIRTCAKCATMAAILAGSAWLVAKITGLTQVQAITIIGVIVLVNGFIAILHTLSHRRRQRTGAADNTQKPSAN